MLASTLTRAAARTALGRSVVAPAPGVGGLRFLSLSPARFGSDYDWNQGIPGSRVKNPAPHLYNDVYPGMGWQWWAYIGTAVATFFYGQSYDVTRPVKIDIGIFGPNMPL